MDRKALVRDYKENRRPMGVFRVLNTANGKSLIGTSVDLPGMLNRQRFQLDLARIPTGHFKMTGRKAVRQPSCSKFSILSRHRTSPFTIRLTTFAPWSSYGLIGSSHLMIGGITQGPGNK